MPPKTMTADQALHFFRQLEVYITKVGPDTGHLDVTVNLDAYHAAIEALQQSCTRNLNFLAQAMNEGDGTYRP